MFWSFFQWCVAALYLYQPMRQVLAPMFPNTIDRKTIDSILDKTRGRIARAATDVCRTSSKFRRCNAAEGFSGFPLSSSIFLLTTSLSPCGWRRHQTRQRPSSAPSQISYWRIHLSSSIWRQPVRCHLYPICHVRHHPQAARHVRGLQLSLNLQQHPVGRESPKNFPFTAASMPPPAISVTTRTMGMQSPTPLHTSTTITQAVTLRSPTNTPPTPPTAGAQRQSMNPLQRRLYSTTTAQQIRRQRQPHTAARRLCKTTSRSNQYSLLLSAYNDRC